jgi:hypothetical protein
MKHFELSDETTVKSLKQVGELFPTYHATEAKAIKDLKLLKKAIKENTAYDWFSLNIDLNPNSKTSYFDKDEAIRLLYELGATIKQVEALTVKGTTKKVSLKK